MREKKRIIAACCITFVATVVITLGFMSAFNVGIGDRVFVSLTEYENVKGEAAKYNTLEELYQFLEENYYTDLKDDDLMTGIYKGLFSGTGDPYTRYLTEEEYRTLTESYSGKFDGIGVTMSASDEGNIEVISVIDDSPAQKAGIRDGDIIVAIENVRYTGAELREATNVLRGKKGTRVKVTINRNGTPFDYNIVREPISDQSVFGEIREDNIGYIRITSFNTNTADQFEEELKRLEKAGVDGLIIDLRSNGGGLVNQSLKIADLLIDEGVIVYMENGKGEKTYQKASPGRTPLEYVVLVNGGSASASEILVAGIQGNKEGKIIGTQTYGKGITQNTWKLKNGSGIEITVSQYFAPDGTVIHKKGITPDLVVELEETDVVDGYVTNDRQLEAAVKEIKEN